VVRRVRAWARWEFGRRIELTGFIRFIIIERFLKGAVLIIGGIVLIVASAETNLHDVAARLQTELNLDPGRHLWRRLYEKVLSGLGTHPDEIGVGAILYGILEGFEGFGLILRRRWAEYLVVVATVAFIPVEIDELLRKPTLIKAAAFVVNVAIVVYLVWRKRLFMERPGGFDPEAPADTADQRKVPA
jgi:uncharacterized membrane protein (DUF2068 family)